MVRHYKREIKDVSVILLVLAFLLCYTTIPPLNRGVNAIVDPAVAGLTLAYGKISTPIYKFTGLDLGFVAIPPDPEFLFSVRLATYINERRAGPLFDIATDQRVPRSRRERALRAVLKFSSASEWIQPFLNELPRGGLLGLYEEESPVLDELIKKIRAQGGIRQPLVRAYAEVVLAFMLQHPDAVIRKHALRWLSDLIAEDSIFLMIPRLVKEEDPQVRPIIESVLLDVRAISEPDNARELLIPQYRNPAWPTLKMPLAVVLARLGNSDARQYLVWAMHSEEMTTEQRSNIRVALAGTSYLKSLNITESETQMAQEHKREREKQYLLAMEKNQRIARQARMKEIMLARAEQEKMKETSEKELPKAVVPAEASREKTSQGARPKTEKSVTSAVFPVAPPVAPTMAEKPVRHDVSERAGENKPLAVASKPLETTKTALPEEKTPPQPFPVPGAESAKEEIPAAQEATHPPSPSKGVPQLASLPPEALPPPLTGVPLKKQHSLMFYVDMVFQVIGNKDVPLFRDPGINDRTGVTLSPGTKGKAEFAVRIGEDYWYQVKTKAGNGWANGSNLQLYNLSPEGPTPVTAEEEQPSTQAESLDNAREESTYFEVLADNIVVYEKPSEKAKKKGTLKEDTAYMAVKSDKAGVDRWFLLQIRAGETGWVRGVDLRLADVLQPAQLKIPTKPLSQRNQKSAFAAEWITAGVKGVGAYSRPSIAGKMVIQISPPAMYKVVGFWAGAGKEWYRIQLADGKDAWVQSLDVNLTKPAAE